jgi:hypothetical protein
VLVALDCYADVLQYVRRKLCQWRIFMHIVELELHKFRTVRNIYLFKHGRSRDSSAVYRWATGWMLGSSNPDRGWDFFST